MNNKKHNGFTIVELMVTILVAAILLALAAPNMADFYQKSQLNHYTMEMIGGIAYARSEAVSRGASVTFQPSDGADWANGWSVVLTSNTSTVFQTGEGFPDSSYSQTLKDSSSATITTISFNSRGRRGPSSSSGSFTMSISDGKGHSKTVSIPISGSPIVQ